MSVLCAKSGELLGVDFPFCAHAHGSDARDHLMPADVAGILLDPIASDVIGVGMLVLERFNRHHVDPWRLPSAIWPIGADRQAARRVASGDPTSFPRSLTSVLVSPNLVADEDSLELASEMTARRLAWARQGPRHGGCGRFGLGLAAAGSERPSLAKLGISQRRASDSRFWEA